MDWQNVTCPLYFELCSQVTPSPITGMGRSDGREPEGLSLAREREKALRWVRFEPPTALVREGVSPSSAPQNVTFIYDLNITLSLLCSKFQPMYRFQ